MYNFKNALLNNEWENIQEDDFNISYMNNFFKL